MTYIYEAATTKYDDDKGTEHPQRPQRVPAPVCTQCRGPGILRHRRPLATHASSNARRRCEALIAFTRGRGRAAGDSSR